jgi:hypothetical protein
MGIYHKVDFTCPAMQMKKSKNTRLSEKIFEKR